MTRIQPITKDACTTWQLMSWLHFYMTNSLADMEWGEIYVWQRHKGTPVFLPGESHGQRSLVSYSPRGHKESDTLKGVSSHAQI